MTLKENNTLSFSALLKLLDIETSVLFVAYSSGTVFGQSAGQILTFIRHFALNARHRYVATYIYTIDNSRTGLGTTFAGLHNIGTSSGDESSTYVSSHL